MKKLFLLIGLALVVWSCKKEQLQSNSLQLSPSVQTISVGEAAVLQVQAQPSSLLEQVVWTSSDSSVVRVVSGIVTGLAQGASTITAAAAGVSAQCLVIVEKNDTITPPTPPSPPSSEYDLSSSRIRMTRSSKRGAGFGSPFLSEDVPLLGSYMCWGYNWGATMTSVMDAAFTSASMEFCPMIWNGNYDANKIRSFVGSHPNCKYLLTFNEPNLKDQANMTPSQAAQFWPDVVALAKELNLKVVSPAMNYGTLSGYSDPIKWMDEFLAQDKVSINDIDAISLHCYMASAGSMRGFINLFDKYNKPIWLTEFCAWEKSISSVTKQMDYMSEAIGFLEQDARVERYAWFLPRSGNVLNSYPYNQLLGKTEPYALSPLGEVFAGLPIAHHEALDATKPVLLNTCSDWCSLAGTPSLATPHFYPMGDQYGSLYAQMLGNQSLSFSLTAPSDLATFVLRAQAYTPTTLLLSIDGGTATQLVIATSETWMDHSSSITLPQGTHTLTLTVASGNTLIHWFVFK